MFRGLHQKKALRELHLENNIHFSCTRKKFLVFIQKREIFQKFEGAEDFIKQRRKEICDRRKISVEEVFYFYISFMLLVI